MEITITIIRHIMLGVVDTIMGGPIIGDIVTTMATPIIAMAAADIIDTFDLLALSLW